jgi:hypothetical protein
MRLSGALAVCVSTRVVRAWDSVEADQEILARCKAI